MSLVLQNRLPCALRTQCNVSPGDRHELLRNFAEQQADIVGNPNNDIRERESAAARLRMAVEDNPEGIASIIPLPFPGSQSGFLGQIAGVLLDETSSVGLRCHVAHILIHSRTEYGRKEALRYVEGTEGASFGSQWESVQRYLESDYRNRTLVHGKAESCVPLAQHIAAFFPRKNYDDLFGSLFLITRNFRRTISGFPESAEPGEELKRLYAISIMANAHLSPETIRKLDSELHIIAERTGSNEIRAHAALMLTTSSTRASRNFGNSLLRRLHSPASGPLGMLKSLGQPLAELWGALVLPK